jgi:HlyD family secretion protein
VHIKILPDTLTQYPSFLHGMTVSANIIAAERESALVLPNDYLLTQPSGNAHVLRWQNGDVKLVEVTLGLRNMRHSEIISGLAQGDIVVQADNLSNENITNGLRARVSFEQVQYVIR